jgi:DNA-binding MarR family transcriptional regulator
MRNLEGRKSDTLSPDDDLGFLMARTYRAMRRWLVARLEPLGLTYKQFQVLNALSEEGNVSQTELATRANMDATALARMLVRMERADLVWRTQDPDDARVNRVRLTAEGRALRARVIPYRNHGLSLAVQGLTEEEVQKLKDFLNRIHGNMSRDRGA